MSAGQGGFAAVHQLVPHLGAGDAVSTHTLEVRELLWSLGYRSTLYAGECDDAGASGVVPARRLRAEAGSALLYQAAIGTPVAAGLGDLAMPLLLNHHTSSPPEQFEAWDPTVAALLRLARHQVEVLAPRAVGAIAVSQHNARELRAAGCAHVEVAPVLRRPAAATPPDGEVAARLARARVGGGADWLFVGRLAPNKAQHDVIKAFAAYRRLVDPLARLHLVGAPAVARYAASLDALVDGLGLAGSVELTGVLSDAALAAHYDAADVFVCLSDHEGFCVPLLEAMEHGVAVVAFAAAAVGETLGGAGLLLPDKSPAVVATAVARVLGDARLRAALAAAAACRLDHYGAGPSRRAFTTALHRLLERAA